MGLKKVLGLVVSFLLGLILSIQFYYPVKAVLNTPVPTFTQVNTPEYDEYDEQNFACPSGTPSGWGSVTPAQEWILLCADCVPTGTGTSTFLPDYTRTFTPDPLTGTPSPTGTLLLTPTETGTPTFTVTPSINISYISKSVYENGCESSSTVMNCSNVSNYAICTFQMSCTDSNNSLDRLKIRVVFSDSRGTGTHTTYYYIEGNSSGTKFIYDTPIVRWGASGNSPFGQVFSTGYQFATGIGAFSVSRTTATTNLGSMEFYIGADEYGTNTFSGAFTISPYAITGTPTPVVSPTPFLTPTPQASYCSSVSDVPPDNPFDYGDGDIVANTCASFMGVSFSDWMSPIEPFFPDFVTWISQFDIQPLTICIVYMNYRIVLFGVVLEGWNIALAIVIIVSALRMWISIGSSLGSLGNDIKYH